MRASGLFISFFCVQVGAQTVPAMDGIADKLQPGNWQVLGIPGVKKPLTRFDAVTLDGKKVLRVYADKSYANLTYTLTPSQFPIKAGILRWRWRLDRPVAGADLQRKEGDDAPIKVCAFFDMPLDHLPFIERNLLRIARKTSGQYLPSATLCYVWDQKLAVGTELPNAYTKRVHYVVLDSASSPLQHWVSHRRDIRTDFMLSFHTETASVPPLLGIGIGADADNTGASSLAYLDDLTLMEQ
jgi:hypothetical protein